MLSFAERDLQHKLFFDILGSIDYRPPCLPISYGRAKLYVLEDNDAVIKMTTKERSPQMRHVARTHRLNLDWLFERLSRDPRVCLKFVGTKDQLADVILEGSFTGKAWDTLCPLCLILLMSKFSSPPSSEKHATVSIATTANNLFKPCLHFSICSPAISLNMSSDQSPVNVLPLGGTLRS